MGELASEIAARNVDLVLFAGDLVVGGVDQTQLESQFLTWRDTMQPVYEAGIGVYVVRGNHDEGSPAGTDRGAVSLSVYYVCDVNREGRADEIWAEKNAPMLNGLQEEGEIASWGWSSHLIGGRFRRLQTITGADYASVVQANGALVQYSGEDDSGMGEEFLDICGSHADYLWNIVHEAP